MKIHLVAMNRVTQKKNQRKKSLSCRGELPVTKPLINEASQINLVLPVSSSRMRLSSLLMKLFLAGTKSAERCLCNSAKRMMKKHHLFREFIEYSRY
jgi:hypothetical protein